MVIEAVVEVVLVVVLVIERSSKNETALVVIDDSIGENTTRPQYDKSVSGSNEVLSPEREHPKHSHLARESRKTH